MNNHQTPAVLLRYSSKHSRDNLSQWLEPDFRIIACSTDEEAMRTLNDPRQGITALIILDISPKEPGCRSILLRTRDQHPGLLRILINDAIGLTTLTALLDEGLIDRCFEHPLDPDQLRSHLLTAALLHHERISATDPALLPESVPPNVLIVDDETTATKYVSRQLNRIQTSFRVMCAASAEQALEMIENPRNRIAVVMTDQRMPGMQGKELLDHLRLSRPDIVRILTSAYGEVGVALDAVNEGGIFRYQTKPWQADRLLPVFREALDQHRALEETHLSRVNETFQAFQIIVRERIRSLLNAIGPLVDDLAGGAATQAFLDTLSDIETLPPNRSHLRASRETPLERRLVEEVTNDIQRATNSLYPGRETLEWRDASQLEYQWQQAVREIASPDIGTPESTLMLLFRSMATLLDASGLNPDTLEIETNEHSRQTTITLAEPLRIYTHLLAPLTRISRPLLDQQCALLIVHLTTRKLSGELNVQGSRQSCGLTIRLPVDSVGKGEPQ